MDAESSKIFSGCKLCGCFNPKWSLPTNNYIINYDGDETFKCSEKGYMLGYHAYLTTDGNIDKFNILVDGESTKIQFINTNLTTEDGKIYSIDGQRINTYKRGINIIRKNDGTNKKLLIR